MEKPWAYHGEWSPSGGLSAKNPWNLRPLGFWPWDLIRNSIHHDTPSAFPNNVQDSQTPGWHFLVQGWQIRWSGCPSKMDKCELKRLLKRKVHFTLFVKFS